jgi:4-amino-4-deoxy-L-arabinose transferase-like glycosyltransferase
VDRRRGVELGALAGGLGLVYLVRLGAYGLVDYDEALYAEVARAMYTTGDFVHPALQGEPFFEKPPLLYWVEALGFAALGVGTAGARLGNALAALAAPFALYAFGWRALGHRVALCAALTLGSSLLYVGVARVALTDVLLLLWMVLGLGCIARALDADPPRAARAAGWWWAGWAAIGLAVLTKGVVAVLLAGGTVGLYGLRTPRVRTALHAAVVASGLVPLAVVGGSWYAAIAAGPGATTAFAELFGRHQVGRFLGSMQGHAGGLLYYMPVLALGLLPWSAFVPLALWRRPGRAPGSFAPLLGWLALLTVVFFSLSATKLPHYVLPALPGIALALARLAAGTAQRADGPPDRGWRASALAASATLALLGLLLAAAPLLARRLPGPVPGARLDVLPGLAAPIALGWGAYAAAAAALLAAVAAANGRRMPGLVTWNRLALAALASYALVFQLVLPRVDAAVAAPLRNLASRAAELLPPDDKLVLLGLRRRPSVGFYGERATEYWRAVDPETFERALAGGRPRLVLTSERLRARTIPPEIAEVIAGEGGYVLLRTSAPSGEGPRRGQPQETSRASAAPRTRSPDPRSSSVRVSSTSGCSSRGGPGTCWRITGFRKSEVRPVTISTRT